MKFITFYKYFNFLSLDVVMGAMSGGILASKLLHTNINYCHLLILGISVWMIYTADHLLDSLQSKNKAPAKRRLFYRKHFKLLVVFEICFLILILFLSIRFLQAKIVETGLITGVFIAIYFLAIFLFNAKKTLWMQKELIVALIYSIGIFISPYIQAYPNIQASQILIFISFFLTVWSDIILIAIFEYDKDKHDAFISLPVMVGIKKSISIMYLLLSASFILLLVANSFFPTNKIYLWSSIIILSIGMIQALIYKQKNYFGNNERYRIITEAIFFLPALMIFTY
jgi:4-hydroxybenzoate polyprenyltransferase